MERITVKPNQTVFDIALEQHSNAEAAGEILVNNPDLQNDPTALSALGINILDDDGFYADAALMAGQRININTQSAYTRPNIAKELIKDITTYGKDY